MNNDYTALLEPWKVSLTLERVRKKRFMVDDLEDAQQDVIQEVIGFRFVPGKSNGATEATAITALIDNRLAFIKRGQSRRRRREDQYREARGSRDGMPIPDPVDEVQATSMARNFDVQSAMSLLSWQERAVCSRLAHGDTRIHIAMSLGLTRYTLERLIDGIREKFEAWELDSWLGSQ